MVTQRSYPGEAADPYCLRAGEAKKLLAGHPWRRFAVLGDSVAEGAGEPAPGYADEPWCDRIAAALRAHQPDLAYLNLGVGNTSAAQVRATQLPTALVFAPGLALVACGGYDILQPAYDPAAVSAEIRTLSLGAGGVLLGRPALWGLASGGARGAAQVLSLLADELTEAMTLAGCPDVGSARLVQPTALTAELAVTSDAGRAR